MKMFYCPKCGRFELNFNFKDMNEERKLHTFSNIRDGYGTPINHVICTNCKNVLAGVITLRENSNDEINYYKDLIEMYNKERKDGGYITDRKLKKLINKIKTDKGLI